MSEAAEKGAGSTESSKQTQEGTSRNAEMKKHYEELRKAYKPPSNIRLFIYDLILWAFCVVFDCFFREIRSRGGFKVPKKESVIFVAAPHANQFVDPIILMSQVKKTSGRRVSCLIAEKSHRRKFIGLVSRSQLAIPVKRAQDNLELKTGKIKWDPQNELRILGENTRFLTECEPKGLLALPKSLGTGVIEKVVSDNELYLKKPFRFASPKTEAEGRRLFEIGTTFKAAGKIDQSEVYAQVFEHLAHGNCIGVFSEGGSHDRPDLLPLKAGVALMALGAMDATPGLNVKIVPVGMNYFHAHKFRSRALVEFGTPIEINDDLLKMYSNSKTSSDAVKILLEDITKGVKGVTVSCPDFETLSVVQAARRMYANNISSQLSISSKVEMTRRLLQGYLHFKDEPRVKALRDEILKYNDNLRSFQIPDHLISSSDFKKSKLLILTEFLSNGVQMIFQALGALPGVILFSPVLIATKRISEKKRVEALAGSTVKIKGNDVIATWKILVALGFAPILYTAYSLIGIKIVHLYYPEVSSFYAFGIFYLLSVSITYSALTFGDRGMDLYKMTRSSWKLLTDKSSLEELKAQRDKLSSEITSLINEYGPQLYPDFDLRDYESNLKLKKSLRNQRRKKQFESIDKGLSEEEELEELKTQELRKRRIDRKQRKSSKLDVSLSSSSLSSLDEKFKILQDTQILNDDVNSSSELSSGSMSDTDVSSSESSYAPTSSKSRALNIIKEKMIKDNREREEQH